MNLPKYCYYVCLICRQWDEMHLLLPCQEEPEGAENKADAVKEREREGVRTAVGSDGKATCGRLAPVSDVALCWDLFPHYRSVSHGPDCHVWGHVWGKVAQKLQRYLLEVRCNRKYKSIGKHSSSCHPVIWLCSCRSTCPPSAPGSHLPALSELWTVFLT